MGQCLTLGDCVDRWVDMFQEDFASGILDFHLQGELIANMPLRQRQMQFVVTNQRDLAAAQRIATFLAWLENRELVGSVAFRPEVVPHFYLPRIRITGTPRIEREVERQFQASCCMGLFGTSWRPGNRSEWPHLPRFRDLREVVAATLPSRCAA